MRQESTLIASGNLATSRRTIMGVLGQCAFLGVGDENARLIFTSAGLPDRALEEPDFPISLEQELIICKALACTLVGGHSSAYAIFNAMGVMGIESLGVLGMAMRHAETAIDALQVCLSYPQLTAGHSRLVVRREGNATLFCFAMERPALRDAAAQEIDTLVEYCLVLDLVTSLRNIQDIVAPGMLPLYMTLPCPQPADWHELHSLPPCPVHFSAPETCLAYPDYIIQSPLPRANSLVYRSYVSIAAKLSQMLAEELSLGERVSRWLWAYTPPPRRGEIARLLAMSERNLTRQLNREGTSYSQLLAQVQAQRAKNFLGNPALSVAAIGERLGYSEPAAFSRAFSQWTGSSPLAWRKSNTRQAR